MDILIAGPREIHKYRGRMMIIDTTSHTRDDWQMGLSPFKLGPVPLYGGKMARNMENAWQFAKVYKEHLDSLGEPSYAYFDWANKGWANPQAVRYPMGRGMKPEFSLWDGRKLGYVDARKEIYFPLYRDAVAKSPAFEMLEELARQHEEICLFDFDGYSHTEAQMTLHDVLHYDRRPMGHAFILKMMLLYGRDVTPDVLAARHAVEKGIKRTGMQASLF